MPFYKITVWLKDSSPVTGVRELNELSIERAWQLFEGKAKEAYKERFAGFDLVMISKRSDIFKDYLDKKNKKVDKSDTFLTMDDNIPADKPAGNFGFGSHHDKSKDKPPDIPWWNKSK